MNLFNNIANFSLLSDAFQQVKDNRGCGNCEKVIKVIGQGEVTKEEKYYIL